jgi:hypothetical protein
MERRPDMDSRGMRRRWRKGCQRFYLLSPFWLPSQEEENIIHEKGRGHGKKGKAQKKASTEVPQVQ